MLIFLKLMFLEELKNIIAKTKKKITNNSVPNFVLEKKEMEWKLMDDLSNHHEFGYNNHWEMNLDCSPDEFVMSIENGMGPLNTMHLSNELEWNINNNDRLMEDVNNNEVWSMDVELEDEDINLHQV